MPVNARNKGHAYERRIINELKEIWPDAVSSRSESKRLDDAGVDICYTDPFYFQCKAVERGINLRDVLDHMPDKDQFNVVLWKQNRKEELAVMSKKDFYKILEAYMKLKEIEGKD